MLGVPRRVRLFLLANKKPYLEVVRTGVQASQIGILILRQYASMGIIAGGKQLSSPAAITLSYMVYPGPRFLLSRYIVSELIGHKP